MCVACPGCTIRDAKFKLLKEAEDADEEVCIVFDDLGVADRDVKSRPFVPGERGVVAMMYSESRETFILCLTYTV